MNSESGTNCASGCEGLSPHCFQSKLSSVSDEAEAAISPWTELNNFHWMPWLFSQTNFYHLHGCNGHLRAFFIGYWGQAEHFRAIIIIQNKQQSEHRVNYTVAPFSASTLRHSFYLLLWISEVIQAGREKKTMTIKYFIREKKMNLYS